MLNTLVQSAVSRELSTNSQEPFTPKCKRACIWGTGGLM